MPRKGAAASGVAGELVQRTSESERLPRAEHAFAVHPHTGPIDPPSFLHGTPDTCCWVQLMRFQSPSISAMSPMSV